MCLNMKKTTFLQRLQTIFPGTVGRNSVVKNLSAHTEAAGDVGSIPGSGRFPWRRKWQLSPVFLPRESHGQGSLVGYSPGGLKELDMTVTTHACMHT